jgi:hypothetical protein
LALACGGAAAAEKIKAALDELIPAARNGVGSLADSSEAVEQYKSLLADALVALESAHWETGDAVVWLRLGWKGSPVTVAAVALGSTAAMESDWLRAAGAVDKGNQRRLATGLTAYARTEGGFPAGAAGSRVMSPETRLSWIAALLPYYGHADWHRQLEFGYPWNGPQNQAVTRQPLAEVVNPALGPAATEAGFPVTNYVGVSGVGPDAGRLDAGDARAGVFGYGRKIRPEDITRGAANTIAILGVTARCGPWAAGGDPTVRSLGTRPYVNGPDGFGSGQSDGMWAGMADGSARFFSKNMDPQLLEQMATIHGEPPVEEEGTAKPQAEVKAKMEEKPQAEAKPEVKPTSTDPGIQARLATAVSQIELSDMPLADAVTLLAGMSNVRVTFDVDAMRELGATLHDKVSVSLSKTSAGEVLAAILASRKLTCVVQDGWVLVTSPAEYRESLREVRYTVSDLTGEATAATEELARLVEKLVVPESWQANGGRGTIRAKEGALEVNQTGSVHSQVLVFCEKLRTARGKPTRSRLSPELFSLATRADRAARALAHPVTANFREPAPLGQILGHLRQSTGAEILLDGPALAAAGISEDVVATLKSQRQPLSAVLGQVLDPLGLGWRAVGPSALQVSTRKAVDSRLELEFYPVASLLGREQAAALIERLKARLPQATWGEGSRTGVVVFDPPSGCLIVLQSQPVQIAIEAVLKEMAR